MISPHDLVTIARALRIMGGYESREMRIAALKQSKFIDVRGLAMQLEAAGHFKDTSAGTMPSDRFNSIDDTFKVGDFGGR